MTGSITHTLQYLEKKKINLDEEEFSFQVNSHPAFPSLLSIVSALNINYVSNYVIEIDNSEINELPDDFMSFIALKGNEQELTYFEKINEGYLVSGKNKISEKELLCKWNNIVVLIDETQSAHVKKRNSLRRYRPLLTGSFLMSLLIFLFYYLNVYSFMFLALSIGGLLLSILSLKKIFGIESSIISKVCTGTYTDCSFSDAENTHFISNFGDYSLVYFLTNIISILFLSGSQNNDVFFSIQRLLLLVIFPVIAYSLFYQLFKVKKVCPLCIGIIIILLLQTYILRI